MSNTPTSFKAKIQSYEVQENGNMRISTLFRLFQKAAGDDSDRYGLTYNYMRDNGIVFVITKMSVKFFSNIKTYDHIEIITRPRGCHGVSFIRDFDVRIDGVRVAYASSTWALININSRRLLRPNALDKIGSIPSDTEDMIDFDQARIKLDENSLSRTDVRKVYYSHIDKNGHMNNTFYPDIVFDYIPDNFKNDFTGLSFSVCYTTELTCGETFEVFSNLNGNRFELLAKNLMTEKNVFAAIAEIEK